jgi:hypothetical protein
VLKALVALASAALFIGAGGGIKGIWSATNISLMQPTHRLRGRKTVYRLLCFSPQPHRRYFRFRALTWIRARLPDNHLASDDNEVQGDNRAVRQHPVERREGVAMANRRGQRLILATRLAMTLLPSIVSSNNSQITIGNANDISPVAASVQRM